MSTAVRPWVVYGVGSVILIGAILFLAYVTGWPATPDSCVAAGNCFCEYFDPLDVENGVKGIRQPVNTWSNLYALITAAIVAFVLSRDRASGATGAVIRSDSPIADGYVFAVLFLGLGSMWFHASMSKYVSWMDGFSMFVFAGYLVFYTLDRLLRNAPQLARTLVFWIGWPVVAIVMTIIAASGVDSAILIAILVGTYILLELITGLIASGNFLDGWIGFRDTRAMVYWLCGLGAFGIAFLFWKLSQTGEPLCFPNSWFQPHGLIWHTFSGIMAVLIYFYWRRENATD